MDRLTEANFIGAIESAGMTPPDCIHADGRLHRFSATGKRGEDAGWYVLHADGVPAGAFGNWKSGQSHNWCAKSPEHLSIAERNALRDRIQVCRQLRQATAEQARAAAAAKAAATWAKLSAAHSHPYLRAKGVSGHGVRVDDRGNLVVPVRDARGALTSLQCIAPTGAKRFLPGGKVRGCYHAIGKPRADLIVCEGYATGATLYEAAGSAVAVAFNAGNLESVALALHAKFPALRMTVAADDDWNTPGNPGVTAAKAAARATGARLLVPDFAGLARGPKDSDFNDLARLAGGRL